MWNLKKNRTNKTENQTHRYKEQTGGCQREGVEDSEMGKRDQKVQNK